MSDYVTKTNVLSALARFKENTDALYETKADANDMKSEINQHDARITNLEQKAGDYSIVQYRGTNAVPTGKAKYGLVKSIVGKSRAWNQLVQNGNFATNDNWFAINGTLTYPSANTARVSLSSNLSSTFGIYESCNTIQGHKYLFIGRVKVSTSRTSVALRCVLSDGGDGSQTTVSVTPNVDTYCSAIVTGESARTQVYLITQYGDAYSSGDYIDYKTIMLYDLTLIFGSGNEPSTVADALAQIPSLGQYNAYDAGSLVDTEVSGVETVGFNRLDIDTYMSDLEISKSGDYYSATLLIYYTKTDANPFPIDWKPNTRYSFRLTGYVSAWSTPYIGITYTDGSFEGICVLTSTSLATVTGTSASGKTIKKVSFNYGDGGTTMYVKSICISEGTDTTTDLPYKTDTLSLPETVTLRSAGSVRDVLTPEDGKKQELIDVVDLSPSQTTWYYNSSIQRFYAVVPNGRIISSQYTNTNAICSKYPISPAVYTTMADKTFVFSDRTFNVESSYIIIRDDSFISQSSPIDAFKSAMSGVYLAYEKSTPTTDTISPIPDNTIYTEGGGTINTIQTQTTKIDNCLDVGYLAV